MSVVEVGPTLPCAPGVGERVAAPQQSGHKQLLPRGVRRHEVVVGVTAVRCGVVGGRTAEEEPGCPRADRPRSAISTINPSTATSRLSRLTVRSA